MATLGLSSLRALLTVDWNGLMGLMVLIGQKGCLALYFEKYENLHLPKEWKVHWPKPDATEGKGRMWNKIYNKGLEKYRLKIKAAKLEKEMFIIKMKL